nr:helicase-related protein [Secundilactobacillus odoratitofui]
MRQQHRFLIFVPHISNLAPTGAALKQLIPELSFETVHAADPKRHEKVQLMRDLAINCLITTTILERGITFPGIDVIVIGANDPVFSTAALVQIAGRVGRKETAPTGLVRFFC